MHYCGQCGAAQPKDAASLLEPSYCCYCRGDIPSLPQEHDAPALGLYCPGCGKALWFETWKADQTQGCPHCWFAIDLPALRAVPHAETVAQDEEGVLTLDGPETEAIPETTLAVAAAGASVPEPSIEGTWSTSGVLCAYCQVSLMPSDTETHRCASCDTAYHQECWEENHGCAMYGCAEAPETEHRQSIEIPPAWWGKDHKPCPKCGEEIKAAARRCLRCGTTFSTTAPQEAEAYEAQQDRLARLPALRRGVIWRTILCLFPLTAPLALLIVPFWYREKRSDIAALPALYDGLCKVGLSLAAIQTLLAVVVLVLYSVL